MLSNLVLGRDVLKLFNLVLADKDKKEENDAINAIMNIDISSQGQNITEAQNIDETVSAENKLVLNRLFVENYVKPERPELPYVRAEVKLTVKDS